MVDTSTIRRLVKTAKQSDVKRCKVAASAISRSGGLIAHANNRTFKGRKKKWTLHAEEMLLRKLHKLKAFSRFRGKITIIVLRISKYDRIRAAKPCVNCQKALEPYRNRLRVLYTTDDGSIGRLF